MYCLEGMRGHRVIVKANVRDEKEACIIIGLPDASMKDSRYGYIDEKNHATTDSIWSSYIFSGCAILKRPVCTISW